MSMKFDAEFDRAAQHPDAFVAVGGRTPDALAGQAHGAEAEPVDGEVAADSEGSELCDGDDGTPTVTR